MKSLLILLLLTACITPSLYPPKANLDRSCPQVVAASYKSLGKVSARTNKSNLTTVAVTIAACVATSGLYCAFAGPVAYLADTLADPYGKKVANVEFNNNMRQGRAMNCTEN